MLRLAHYIPVVVSRFLSGRDAESASLSSPRMQYECGPGNPYDSSIRTMFTDTEAHIYAWPSKGGVIILNSADAVDFDFLSLDPLDPPSQRLSDQTAEDAFCQRLLLLGAKWWDSEARYDIVSAIEDEAQGIPRTLDFKIGEEPPPTMREKRLTRVAWPSTGGVWVADFDTTWAGVDDPENLLPYDAETGQLKMARTMDERAILLRDRFNGRHYKDIEEFDGYGFFNCWETKDQGEVGPLLLPHETYELWKRAYYGRFQGN
jgi:hypothetical protein